MARTGQIVNSAELARIFGLNYETIQLWINEGMPCLARPEQKTGARGWQIDCGEVLRWREKRAAQQMKLELGCATDYDTAKARKMQADAGKAELDLAIREGRALWIEDVIMLMTKHIGSARARLLGMPAKYSPMLAVEENASACEEILASGVREALEELSGPGTDVEAARGILAELRPGVAAESSEDLGTAAAINDLGMGGSEPAALA